MIYNISIHFRFLKKWKILFFNEKRKHTYHHGSKLFTFHAKCLKNFAVSNFSLTFIDGNYILSIFPIYLVMLRIILLANSKCCDAPAKDFA